MFQADQICQEGGRGLGEADQEDPSDGDDQAEEAHLDLPPKATGLYGFLENFRCSLNGFQRSNEQVTLPVDVNGGLCYEEHNGVIEMDLDAKIVPTYSFEEIRNQIEEKWKEEIKTKMGDVSKNILRNIKII